MSRAFLLGEILPALQSAMTPEQLKHVQTSLGLPGFQLRSKEAVISSLTKSFIEFLETSDGREWLQIGVNVFFGTGSSANKEEEKRPDAQATGRSCLIPSNSRELNVGGNIGKVAAI